MATFRSCCFVNRENVAGRLGVPRGNSRWFPLGLVWAKRHDVSAAGHKVQKYKSTKVQKYKAKITPGFRLKSIAGMTPYSARAGWNLAILLQTKFEKSGEGEAPRR
ncbi:hypothetical protein ABHN84_09915 [Shewanella vesiculosa]|uniref:Uncharacterized protein n=1 Tax=Shewanella vesiculosa TaxID=518738 RepID=A0ABV0FRI5_9GAMM